MANNEDTGFQLEFPENKKKNSNLTSTEKLSFDSLGDFSDERDKVKRKLDERTVSTLKIDYTNFEKHVFFDSAASKFDIARTKLLTTYPFNGTTEEKDAFYLTASGYENYIFNNWPHYVGYTVFNGSNQYISGNDQDNKLLVSSSSLYVSAWIDPVVVNQNMILQVMSASTGPVKKHGYEFYVSGAIDPHVKFTLYSGSDSVSVSAAFNIYTGSFNNVAAIYDQSAGLLSLYISSSLVDSGSVTLNAIEFRPIEFYVGSGTQYDSSLSIYEYYSGSLNELRVAHTASELFHQRMYNKPIDAESYLKLNYKFNESITGTGSIDKVIIDYSKSTLHGTTFNYDANFRVSGTVMLSDPGDPILYSFHSGVMAFTSSVDLSASLYDQTNINYILRLIPEDLLIEDERASGLLESFSLSIARYFDELKLFVDQFDNLRITNYDEIDETPDVMLPLLKKYFGIKVTEHFRDANPLEFFFGDKVLATGSLDTTLLEVKNQFWRRILNNLSYIVKSKGKRHVIDAFLNTIGVNKNNISIKEYGHLPGSAIQDVRIHKEKTVSMLGMGTGSITAVPDTTGSYVKIPNLITANPGDFTVEAMMQLPYTSASYITSGSIELSQGAIWQFIDPEQVTGSFTLLWNITNQAAGEGKFILTSSDGQLFSSSDLAVFDGDIVNIAAGLDAGGLPFIDVRTVDIDELDLSSSEAGSVALTGVFTGSKYDFVIGANSGSIFENGTTGFFGEIRYWNRVLSSSELDDHALNFESIGIRNPFDTSPLVGHWPLIENSSSNATGILNNIQDLSRNGRIGTGSLFEVGINPYDRFLLEYNYLSPNIDLKWTENKVRIRNRTELKLSEVASDTTEVALEFNLVDALNQDISKIFSSLEIVNNAVGNPINKYREDYETLEAYRRVYFDRLTREINFTDFFKLYKWFDRKLSNSIKQLLPARVQFVGGEQVIESHFLERPRYEYKYPIFRTPKEVPEGKITGSHALGVFDFDGEVQKSLVHNGTVIGTYVSTLRDNEITRVNNNATAVKVSPRESLIDISASISTQTVDPFADGDERVDRMPDNFFRVKMSGDTKEDILNPNITINAKNEWARRKLQEMERDNYETVNNNSGNIFINKNIGNAFVMKAVDSSKNQEQIFGGANKEVTVITHGIVKEFTGSSITLTGSASDINEKINFNRIEKNSKGHWFVAGYTTMSGSNDYNRWYVARSKNEGTSWKVVDNIGNDATATNQEWCTAIALDTTGNIYTGGRVRVSSDRQATVRSSSVDSNGEVWGTVDGFQGSAGNDYEAVVRNLYVDPVSDDIYAFEAVSNDSAVIKWTVRRSQDSGSTWSTIDSYASASAMDAEAYDGIVSSTDTLIVVCGYSERVDGDEKSWVTRISTDEGSSFTVTDYDSGSQESTAKAAIQNTNGDILVGGILYGKWHIKRSASGSIGATGSWTTVDNIATKTSGTVNAFAYDSDNDILYVVGNVSDGEITGTNTVLTGTIKYSLDQGVTWETLVSEEYISGGFNDIMVSTAGRVIAVGDHGATGNSDYEGRIFEYSFFSQSIVAFESSSFSLTGSATVPGMAWIGQKPVIEEDNTHIDNNDTVEKFFGPEATTASFRYNPEIKFLVSASNTAFSLDDFDVYYRDANSDTWGLTTNVSNFGGYFELTGGWYEYRSQFSFGGNKTPPISTFSSSLNIWGLTVNTGTIYTFDDFQFNYEYPLSLDGAKIFKDDNLISRKRNIMPIITSSIRDFEIHPFDFLNIDRSNSRYSKIFKDSQNNYFAVGGREIPSLEENALLVTKINSTFIEISSSIWESSVDELTTRLNDIAETDDGKLWAVGASENKFVALSSSDRGNTWQVSYSESAPGGASEALSVYVTGNDVYVGGVIRQLTSSIRKYTTAGGWDTSYYNNKTIAGGITGIVIFDGDMYFVSSDESVAGTNMVVYKDTALNASFSEVDNYPDDGTNFWGSFLKLDNSILYVGGYKSDDPFFNDKKLKPTAVNGGTWVVRKSSDGSSWSAAREIVTNDNGWLLDIDFDSDGRGYIGGSNLLLQKSEEFTANNWDNVYNGIDVNDFINGVYVDTDSDTILLVGTKNSSAKCFIAKGQRQSNSDFIGPQMLATSARYFSVDISGNLESKAQLFNVSEFPHSMGIYQMPNMILGTQTRGSIGSKDTDIIQITYFGSVVKVLWPAQKIDIPVKGFGDVAPGQRVGKLTTNFEPGATENVTKYDHLSLYCYILKEVVGTQDHLEIKVERRPLKSAGYAPDQAIDYDVSGSFAVANLRDIIYKKDIDYSNLDIKEIGFPIDIPLVNVREIRVSARLSTGQTAEENKNFIVWGRLIRSTEET
jgi:hypothetical protein